MSKKNKRKGAQSANGADLRANAYAGQGYEVPPGPQQQYGAATGDSGAAGYGPAYGYAAGGAGAGAGAGAAGIFGTADGTGAQGLLHGLQGMIGSRQTEQFVLGALIGAAAVYVLGDEDIRGRILKTGMKLYAGIAGSFEEFKEQMADVRAEVEAEQQGQS